MQILVVAADPDWGRRFEDLLRKAPSRCYEVLRVAGFPQAQEAMEHVGINAALLDLAAPSSDSLEMIERLRRTDPGLPIVALVDQPESGLAAEALRRGAQSILARAQVTPDLLDRALQVAVEHSLLNRELRGSDAAYRALEGDAGEGLWILDAKNKTLSVNSRLGQLLGYAPSEMIGKTPLEFMDEEGKSIAAPRFARLGGGQADRLELRFRRKDGSRLWARISALPLYDAQGRSCGSTLRVTDITERRQQEEALHRLAAIVEYSSDAIIGEDLSGTILSWNRAAERLWGYSAAEAIGRSIRFLAPPERQIELDGILSAVRQGQAIPPFETVRKSKEGKPLFVSVSVSPIKDGEGKPVGASAIVRDVSAQKKLEEEFRQAQKMEAVGRLAGGVAHDFNNLLTVICGYAGMLLARTPRGTSSYQELEEIAKAGERASSLTRQLLAFSRKQILKPQVLELNPILADLEKMLKRLIGEDIVLTTALQKDLGRVKVDAGQIEQVVMNLAVNARDAMPNGGKLIIETRNATIEPGSLGSHPELAPGSYVVLSVSDTGMGMDKEVLSHLFEPFFTTKGLGKGTGLGLSTIYGIVRQSDGVITVYSEPGKGSCFRVYLPNTTAKTQAAPAAVAPVGSLEGDETVLVVEDNEMVRKLTSEALSKKGYQVTAVNSADEALDYCSRVGFPDLIVSDLVLPGMDGLTLCRQAAQQKCGIKRLLMTGYTEGATLHQGVTDSGIPLLHKPFSPLALLTSVREILGRRAPLIRP